LRLYRASFSMFINRNLAMFDRSLCLGDSSI
jgi:hypothetical protein